MGNREIFPFQRLEAVTPSDTVDLPWDTSNNQLCRWFIVLAAWDVEFNTPSNWPDWTVTTHVLTWAVAWYVYAWIVTRILDANTTATVWAWY